MIKLLFCCWLIFPAFISAQTNDDTIIWSAARQLTWDDFKGNYDTAIYNRQYGATTFWKVRYEYRPILVQNKIDFAVYAWFDAQKSWVRSSNIANKKLLLHEQGHFNLAELLARQFRQQLSETTFSRTGYADSIKLIFGKLLAGAFLMQEKYDTESTHGMNNKRQSEWQIFIASELKKLEKFADKNISSGFVR